MRVVHVLAEFSDSEGMGRFVAEIGKRAASIESMVITNRRREDAQDVEAWEVGGSSHLFHVTRQDSIEKLLERVKPDLVHLHGGIFIPLLALSPPFGTQELIFSIYAWPSLPSLADLWSSGGRGLSSSAVFSMRVAAAGMMPAPIVRLALKRRQVKTIITQDPKLRDRLGRLTRKPVQCIGNGTDIGGVRAAFASSRPIIVSAGRAELSRGFDLLLRAWRALLTQDETIRLRLLLLPGRDIAKIRRLARRLNVEDRVEILEGVADDLRRELATGTVAAFPFRYDFCTSLAPLTITEAMSVGLPVIGTDAACMASILKDGVNGIVVRKGDRAALTKAIRQLLSDGHLWRDLSNGAIDTVRRSSWQSAVDGVTRTYELASERG